MIHATQAHGFPSAKEAEYLDGWRRARAEFDNYRKRVTREQAELVERARAAAVQNLLIVADNFRTMTKHMPPDLAQNQWAQGVAHIARQLEQLLLQQGVSIISQTNVPFDPAIHEAIEKIQAQEIKSGFVLEIIQPGYKLGEHILKPARVKVSA